jgi:hypothetical protein
MRGYRCYFVSGESIQAVRTFECADDAEVISKAGALLKSQPEHPAIEIWEGQRLVARLTKDLLANAGTQHEGKIYALHGKPK